MNRSDFRSLAELVERAPLHDRGAAESAVDQIHEVCRRVAPQGDPTGMLDAAALLLRHRAELRHEDVAEVTAIVVRLIDCAGERHASPERHEPVVLKAPGPREPIPSELSETSLRLVSDLYIGEILVREGHVTDEQLDQALRFQQVTGERLGEALVNLGAVTWKQVEAALRQQGKPDPGLRPSGTEG